MWRVSFGARPAYLKGMVPHFALDPSETLARGRADLRMGLPVVLTHGPEAATRLSEVNKVRSPSSVACPPVMSTGTHDPSRWRSTGAG